MLYQSRTAAAHSGSRQRIGHCLPELGGGSAPTHKFLRGGALDESELEGNSPKSLWIFGVCLLCSKVAGGGAPWYFSGQSKG
jgi:hypothetical protein